MNCVRFRWNQLLSERAAVNDLNLWPEDLALHKTLVLVVQDMLLEGRLMRERAAVCYFGEGKRKTRNKRSVQNHHRRRRHGLHQSLPVGVLHHHRPVYLGNVVFHLLLKAARRRLRHNVLTALVFFRNCFVLRGGNPTDPALQYLH